jgi:Mg-chelatase subunit ChlD
MFGRFEPVRSQLKDSIERLAADQFFYILFFQDGDRILESGRGVFVRANSAAKKTAIDFIEQIRPSGPTNAVGALRRAMQIRDSIGQGPELIYFLTDGFDLQENGAQGFAEQIETLRKTLAPRAKINTIGFLIEETDLKILQDVAKTSGGQFTRVE